MRLKRKIHIFPFAHIYINIQPFNVYESNNINKVEWDVEKEVFFRAIIL